ncbi:UDP-forming cellulose synthase catalytic subunit [Acidihalobacter prosperus]|uniref:Cellulose synthase catalytic subunit [UDP-forming] n=1 Tax=Acidihalobacter prosperus TaxID=160660 RepID=A0A1A6C3D5_9GAMM|nr:UDP-forming cellulose synthase catalytic subunit [Acidihalobacter prosperus]OBS09055.1 Cellulose synthase catalytic subunit [UDP-forming] [Acidihalobacter prosperus]
MDRIKRVFRLEETLLMAAFVAGVILFSPMIAVPFEWQAQALLGLGFVVLAILVNRLFKAHWITYFLMALSLFATARYAYWRATETLGFGVAGYHWYDIAITLTLFLAEVYAWLVLVLGFLQTAYPLQRKPQPLPTSTQDWPTVDVYIPTYNESLDVVRPTVLAAMQMDWPRDKFAVYLLDDGVRSEFRDFARDVGVGYITRSEHKHAKAGNLNHALGKTDGEYIAIFDSDHVPTRSFLQVAMGWFLRDDKLGLVQTPHHFYSPDPFERNLNVFKRVPNEGELFYGVVQDGNDLWNAAFFCGSCAVMRREALEQIGGIATETVTEDAHTSLKLQRLGWNSAYLNVPQAAGLATDSFSGHVGQRIRWARGMAQIMRVDNPLTGPGLKPMQRLCYLNAMLHFFFAVPRLIFLTAPLLYLYFGVYVINAYALSIAAYSLPHLALAMIANSRVQGRHRNSFWNEVYETALAPYILLPTLLAVINPKLGKFNVTAKGGLVRKAYFDRRFAAPFVVLFLLNAGGLVAAVMRWHLEPHADTATIVMTTAWTIYNLLMISVVLGVNWETRQVREKVRVPLSLPAMIYRQDGHRMLAKTVDVSEGGTSLQVSARMPLGDSVIIGVVYDGSEYRFPATVTFSEENLMRLRFSDLNNEQTGDLVRIIYGRADAWVGWGEARQEDRPWRSLVQVGLLAIVGVGRLLRGIWTRAPRAQAKPAGASAAKSGATSTMLAVLLLTGIAGLAGLPQPVQAETAAAQGSISRHWTLGDLGAKRGLRMTGVDGVQGVALSIPPDQVVAKAEMTMRYHLSPGLLPRVSQINVLLNDQVVRAIPVQPGDNQGNEHTVTFPVNPNLFSEYNHLGFQLIGHYTDQCEDPSNSTLWATISPRTELTISGARLALSNNLRYLPAPFFYKSLQDRLKLPFVFFTQPGSTTLQAAGIVASWFGDLASYRGTDFPVDIGSLPSSGNAVVFATSQNLPPLAGLPVVSGPMIAVTANPNDTYGKILWVLGENEAQLVTAARGLVLGSAMLEGADTQVASVEMPPLSKPDDAPRWVPSTGPVRLDALAGWNPMAVKGTGTLPFTFYLPPSLFLWDRPGVPVNLHYGYNSVPIAANSTLNLNANGNFVHAFDLPQGAGVDQQQKQELSFPASVLHPYANSMSATFYFVPVKGKCTQTNVYNAAGVIYPDSTIDLRGIPHYTRLPALSIWMNGGYPFTRYADLSRTAVVLPATADVSMLHAYLNVMGMFGQQTGMPGIRVAVVRPHEAGSVAARNLLAFTTPDGAAMQQWGDHLPLVYGHDGIKLNNLAGWFAESRWHLPWWNGDDRHYGEAALGRFASSGAIPQAVIEEGVSPLHHSRALLVMSARGDAGWEALLDTLASADKRKHVFGNLSIVHGDEVSSFILHTPDYYVGKLPAWTWLRYHMSRHPWVIWIGVVIAALILAWLVGALLRRRAAKRLPAN